MPPSRSALRILSLHLGLNSYQIPHASLPLPNCDLAMTCGVRDYQQREAA
eukprot:CAMPEP_0181217888 /NCGR_PEP_ID=MMETSP1096-20121128/27394_1 /TAXON_ID=156174 ORGANISM="Chrysochromulina ericina, Strain CCMP281" /NCGR_SAMPLE_ID=MMETSP1096 /ASSEMBLY_ACC=CAM_ASM_000453 /LENGTH=49 /DNA_ID= /DNA_START= /DNA_END= /DNA_ORIENTATION=